MSEKSQNEPLGHGRKITHIAVDFCAGNNVGGNCVYNRRIPSGCHASISPSDTNVKQSGHRPRERQPPDVPGANRKKSGVDLIKNAPIYPRAIGMAVLVEARRDELNPPLGFNKYTT